jgi:bis(5'-nucleosidyl)-tetraphosphatase
MKHEQSFGIIPLQKQAGEWHVLLVRLHSGGHWSFPKGHGEKGETPLQTAERELQEETALIVRRYLSDIPIHEHYQFSFKGNHINKTVTYFLAEVVGDVIPQPEEIAECQWMLLPAALQALTFPEAKKICQKAMDILSNTNLRA